MIQEITKAILKAVAQVRKKLKAQQTPRSRGRPSGSKATQLVGKNQRLRQKVADLFGYRYLFVQHAFLPNLEKTLTFLDDALLPSTSNAVERTKHRHRKMKKSIYRVRTRQHIRQRIALDMQREARLDVQSQTTRTLHQTRTNKHDQTPKKRKTA